MNTLTSVRHAASLVFVSIFAMGLCHAETIVIKAEGVRFIPDIVRANVGDVIAFRNMATQRVEGIAGMWPEGAVEMSSEPSTDYDYPIEHEGLYVFKCPPHWGARMGGVLAVGSTTDFAAKAREYLAIADTQRDAKPAGVLLRKFAERLAAGALP